MTDHLHALPAGHRLNEYRIEGVIGSGGFGITYRAWDIQLDKVVAIKEYFPNEFAVRTDVTNVQPKSTADQDDYQWGLTRFQDEARTLARFEHPHLNQVHRHFEGNGTAYMVLEYIEGETLSVLLRREGRLEPSRLQRLVEELLSGLDEIHDADYVHRDIKPSNIMLRKNGSSVLLDFGAARQVLGQHSKNLTAVFTPIYAPIEECSETGDIGPWTDLYALGMVAYRCVSGISEAEVIGAIRRARLKQKDQQDKDMKPAVEIGKGHYPLSLLKAIDWAIKVEEDDRPQNVVEMQEAIAGSEVSDAVPDVAPVDKPAKQPTEQSRPPKSEQFGGWVLVLVLAWGVVIVLVGGFLSWSASVEHEPVVEREPEIRPEQLNQAERKRREEAAQIATAQKCQSYYNNKAYANALDSCLRAAEQGDVSAQNTLGYMHWTGQGVPHDYIEAFKWYRKSAEQGNALAQNNLGYMYQNGHGVIQDYTEAVKWYRKSAEQGNAPGQHNLGYMYQYGYGVAQDYTEAVKWYRKSAEQGNAFGQYNLGRMYRYGYGVARDYTVAVKWFRKAAEQGNALSQKGVLQDYTEAVKWHRKSAEQGHAPGQFNLGAMYYNGNGVARDYTEAVKWFRKAAEQGHASGQYHLGVMYHEGRGGLRRNIGKAREWYRKAAAQGHASAKKALSKL